MHRIDLISKKENFPVKINKKIKKGRPPNKASNDVLKQKIKKSIYSIEQQTIDDFIKITSPIVINIDNFIKKKSSNLKNWTIEQVCDFIKSIPGCQDFESSFKDQVNLLLYFLL